MNKERTTYEWDWQSCAVKAISNKKLGYTGNIKGFDIDFTIFETAQNNDNADAYRNCKNCGRHRNYHPRPNLYCPQ